MTLKKLTQAQMDSMTTEEILRHNHELQLQREDLSFYRYARCPLCTLHMTLCVCEKAEEAGIAIPQPCPTMPNGRFVNVKELNVYRRALMTAGLIPPRKIVNKRAYQL
jgi:hypothetical protein